MITYEEYCQIIGFMNAWDQCLDLGLEFCNFEPEQEFVKYYHEIIPEL